MPQTTEQREYYAAIKRELKTRTRKARAVSLKRSIGLAKTIDTLSPKQLGLVLGYILQRLMKKG